MTQLFSDTAKPKKGGKVMRTRAKTSSYLENLH